MMLPLWALGIGAAALLWTQFFGRMGKHFGTDVLVSIFGVPLLTRRKYRSNELRTVRESFPYVGTREAYLECRTASYMLLGLLVRFEYREVEIPTNTLIPVMLLGDSISKESLDACFPAYLAYGKDVGKGMAMIGDGLPVRRA